MDEGFPKQGADWVERERYVTLARWSWLCPVIAWVSQLLIALGGRGLGEVIGAAGFLVAALGQLALLIMGVVLGVRALGGVRQHGASGIKAPAIVGIAISAATFALIAVAAVMFVLVARRAG
jgi:hypothetical protein